MLLGDKLKELKVRRCLHRWMYLSSRCNILNRWWECNLVKWWIRACLSNLTCKVNLRQCQDNLCSHTCKGCTRCSHRWPWGRCQASNLIRWCLAPKVTPPPTSSMVRELTWTTTVIQTLTVMILTTLKKRSPRSMQANLVRWLDRHLLIRPTSPSYGKPSRTLTEFNKSDYLIIVSSV